MDSPGAEATQRSDSTHKFSGRPKKGTLKKTERSKDRIGVRVGKIINKYKMAKHFVLHIDEDRFDFERHEKSIRDEAALDGIYVIRTSVSAAKMDADESVRSYKSLTGVERAFKSLKSIDLMVRPIRHYTEDRVRAHIFLCMLTYYVQRYVKEAVRPMLFSDDDLEPKATRDPVAPAKRSRSARKKTSTKRLDDGIRRYEGYGTNIVDVRAFALWEPGGTEFCERPSVSPENPMERAACCTKCDLSGTVDAGAAVVDTETCQRPRSLGDRCEGPFECCCLTNSEERYEYDC